MVHIGVLSANHLSARLVCAHDRIIKVFQAIYYVELLIKIDFGFSMKFNKSF